MAELIFRDLVKREHFDVSVDVSSYGTSDEEDNNPIFPRAVAVLRAHGIEGKHRAQRLTLLDVMKNDYVLVMDSSNLFDVLRLTKGKYAEKIFKLGAFTEQGKDISDPWFTRDFEKAYADIKAGCEGFMEFFKRENGSILYCQRK
jgi:protein-tyrosine phosphatase